MRFSGLCIVAIAASLLGVFTPASAFVIVARQFPACATQCIASADYGSCSLTDNACLCNSPSFVSSASACIATSCKGDELQAAMNGAQALCASVGVTLSHSPTSTVPMCTQPPSATTALGGRSPPSQGASASSVAHRVHAVNAIGPFIIGLGAILLWLC